MKMEKENELKFKKDIFKTPEGYFERLPSQIQLKINEVKKKAQPYFSFEFKLHLSSVTLLMCCAFWFHQQKVVGQVTITKADILEYLAEEEYFNIDTHTITESIEEVDKPIILEEKPSEEMKEAIKEYVAEEFDESLLLEL